MDEKKKAYAAAWREANRERLRANAREYSRTYYAANAGRRKQYREANRERENARVREWREANKAYKKAEAKEYYEANSQSIKAKSRQNWTENRDVRLQAQKQRRLNNPEASRERNRQWQKANPQKAQVGNRKRRMKRAGASGSHTPAEWIALVYRFQGHCLCCRQFFGLKKLTADHVTPVSLGGSDDIANIQPLCKPCNSRKGNHHATDYRETWGQPKG